MTDLGSVEVRKGATVKDVPSEAFIKALAAHFKRTNKIEVPEWADLVKTATYKELAPTDPDWYYVRAASIARKIYLNGGQGVGGLTRWYGGRRGVGVHRAHKARAAKGIIRHILQQLGEADLLAEKPGKKGRYITQKGQQELDVVAGQIVLSKKVVAEA